MRVNPILMNLLAALLLSHFVGDFPLQPNQIYRLKNEHWLGIALHVVIHVTVTSLLIPAPLTVWPMLLLLGILHFGIDLVKLRVPLRSPSLGFLLDQGAHLIVLWALAQFWSNASASVLPLAVLIPLILYGLLLATLVFLWVLANELTTSDQGNRRYVQWASHHLLSLSQVAGLPLLFILAVQWYQHWFAFAP